MLKSKNIRSHSEQIERAAIWLALIFALSQAVTVLITGASSQTVEMIGGPVSVAAHALIFGTLAALIVTPIMYRRGIRLRNEKLSAGYLRRKWDVVPITLLVVLFIIGVFEAVSRSFVNVQLDLASATTILLLSVGFLAYVIAGFSARLRASGLLYIVVLYLFGTLFLSTATQDNPLWWQKSFSYLGMSDSNSRYIFDIGLIFTGMLTIVWQQFFMSDYATLVEKGWVKQRSARIIQIAYIAMGAMLASVGIFRYGLSSITNAIHDTSATGAVVIVGLLMLFMYWLNAHYIRAFYVISWVLVSLLPLAAILKVTGYFNLVGLELLGFVFAGLWSIFFAHNSDILIEAVRQERS